MKWYSFVPYYVKTLHVFGCNCRKNIAITVPCHASASQPWFKHHLRQSIPLFKCSGIKAAPEAKHPPFSSAVGLKHHLRQSIPLFKCSGMHQRTGAGSRWSTGCALNVLRIPPAPCRVMARETGGDQGHPPGQHQHSSAAWLLKVFSEVWLCFTAAAAKHHSTLPNSAQCKPALCLRT